MNFDKDESAFRCFICREEREELFRVRLQEWPAGPCPFEERARYQIFLRLVCSRCFFVFPIRHGHWYSRAVLHGRDWCLRFRADHLPTVYTRDSWHRYLLREVARDKPTSVET